MAHGRPDFFGTPVHPNYGTSLSTTGITDITTTLLTPIVTVAAKGVTLGGYVFCAVGAPINTDIIYLYVDGQLLFGTSYIGLLDLNHVYPNASPLFLSEYDVDSGEFGVSLSPLIPFENELALYSKAVDVNLRRMQYLLSYTSIEE